MSPTITEKTRIPVGLAVLVIGGGAIWMTKINFEITAQATQVFQLREKVDKDTNELAPLLREIEKRLAIIEGELRRIRR